MQQLRQHVAGERLDEAPLVGPDHVQEDGGEALLQAIEIKLGFTRLPVLPLGVEPPYEWTCVGSKPEEQVELHLYLIAKDYSWVKGEVDRIDLHHTQKSLYPLLQAPGVQQRLKQADRLVAIGTSSCENEDRRREEIRSLARARQLSRWIEQAYGAAHEPMVLPLGQYEGECPQEASETAYQRRVAIVALQHDGAPRRLGECLEHVFGQQSQGGQFPPFLARYSLPRRCTLDELLRIDTHGFDGTDCVQGAQL